MGSSSLCPDLSIWLDREDIVIKGKSIIKNCVIELLPDGKGIEIKKNPEGIEITGNTFINSGLTKWVEEGIRIDSKE